MQNQNKGYAKQERKDLMNDNPIAKDASGGRSWISKHSKSGFGSSPLQQKKSPIKNNEDGQTHSQLGKKELRNHMKVKHGKKSPKVSLAEQPKAKAYKNPTFPDLNDVPAKAEPVYKVNKNK